jgi:hypothetical protein
VTESTREREIERERMPRLAIYFRLWSEDGKRDELVGVERCVRDGAPRERDKERERRAYMLD